MMNASKGQKARRIKRFIYILIALIMIVALLAPVGNAFAMPHFEDATVTGDEVNMRMRPTTDSPVILKLSQGARIGVFCEEIDGWYRIIYGNYRGYISSDFVFLPSTDYIIGNVVQSGLKLRQSPGTYSNVVATLNEGTGLTITNISGEWYYVEVAALSEEDQDKALAGYVHKDFVNLSSGKTAGTLLKVGMSGALVRNIQQKLRDRNFLTVAATGYFGDVTEGAVKAFQKKAGIQADGIVGTETYNMLMDDSNGIVTTTAELYGIRGDVKLSTWDDIAKVFKKGTKALVTDVRSGRQFWVRRFGGWFHADSEPLTKEDTAIMKKCYGGEWSWDRRAIWVTVGSVTYAASMNGMPHLSSPTKTNDFPGHFCIHFKDSKVHENSKECPRHQSQVKYAYKKAH